MTQHRNHVSEGTGGHTSAGPRASEGNAPATGSAAGQAGIPASAGRPATEATVFARNTAALVLDEPVTRLNGVREARAKALAGLGVRTVRDLLFHVPRRYLDLTHVTTAAEAHPGETVTVAGTVHDFRSKRPRYNLSLVVVDVVDDTGLIVASFFHQPWLMRKLERGMRVAISGTVEFNYGYKRMTNPVLEELAPGVPAGFIRTIHPASSKVSAAQIRALEHDALQATVGMPDPLPVSLRTRRRLMARHPALATLHFPHDFATLARAKSRLAYEELLFLQLYLLGEERAFLESCKREGGGDASSADPVGSASTYSTAPGATAPAAPGSGPAANPLPDAGLMIQGPKLASYRAGLPFELTNDQRTAADDLLARLASPWPANHLILGDVGTGKTVLAAFALAAAADSGEQAYLMAPTEVLARQHFANLAEPLARAGVRCALLTGSTPSAERAEIARAAAAGELDVLVGTHTLIEGEPLLPKAALAVIDEEQRFGVAQRTELRRRAHGLNTVSLSATPIPRSLALAVFAQRSTAFLTERPGRRAPVESVVVDSKNPGEAYDAIRAALTRGEQAYVVCPFIGTKREGDAGDDAPEAEISDEKERLGFELVDRIEDVGEGDVKAAETHARMLQDKTFPNAVVGLLHGGMAPAEKAEVMQRFKDGEIDVLVSTTVIEVGVDVPRATVMVVEDAERFGLSQLHQLRGRVGRGDLPGRAYFVSGSRKPEALARLRDLAETTDGFQVAQADLARRGEGDLLGLRQAGASSLKVVDVTRDAELISAAYDDAHEIFAQDPDLAQPRHAGIRAEVELLARHAAAETVSAKAPAKPAGKAGSKSGSASAAKPSSKSTRASAEKG